MQGYNPDWSGLLNAQARQGKVLGKLGQTGGQMIAQKRQQSAINARDAEAREALQSGNIGQINEVAMKYPELGESLRSAFKFENDATEENFKETNFNILSDPTNAKKYLTDRVSFLEGIGSDATQPKARLAQLEQNPEGFLKTTEGITAAAYAPEYKAWRDSQGQSDQMTQYQREMVRQKDVSQDLKRQEIELKRLERQEKRETDELKKQEIKQRISDKKTRMQQAEQGKVSAANDAVASSDEGINLINQIENHPGFSSYVGAKGVSSAFGLKDQPIAGTEAAGVASLIDTLGSQQFLNAVQSIKGMGALSDAEGKKLSSAISSLDPNMSETDFKKSLATIKRFFSRAKYKAQNTIEKSKPTTGGEFTSSGGVTFTVE